MCGSFTVAKRIGLGFGAVVVPFICFVVMNIWNLSIIERNTRNVSDGAIPRLTLLGSIGETTGEIQLAVLRHLLAKTAEEKTTFEERLKALRQKAEKDLAQLENMLPEGGHESFRRLMTLRDEYIKARGPLLELSRANRDAEAAQYLKATLRPAYTNYVNAQGALAAANNELSGQMARSTLGAVTRSRQLSVALGCGATIIALCTAFWIIWRLNRVLRNLADTLDQGAAQVAAAATQVAAASQSLSEGASEQAASLEETSASLEEMTSMIRSTAEAAQRAKELSAQTQSSADTGQADMTQMEQSMAAIKGSSDEVAKIVKNIDEIAFQTNILALNAAVEAARAGEAGTGFAVVADEVRNLAQRSAAAARETADKIEVAITQTAEGVQRSIRVAESLRQIVTKARSVDEIITQIATASGEQAQGVSQINTAVSEMDKVTQSNAANAEQTASASNQLGAQAVAQKETVAQLMHLVGMSAQQAGQPKSRSHASARDTDGAEAREAHSDWPSRAHGHKDDRSGTLKGTPEISKDDKRSELNF
jgi:methyl-accepting chemotaxis protein